MITYVIICCGHGFCKDDESEKFTLCFADVVMVWTADKCRSSNCMGSGSKRLFFPLVCEAIREGIEEGCKVEFLAGVVMCQAFLMRLCLKLDQHIPRAELAKDTLNWSANTIAGFRNFYFMDALLRMLLHSVLTLHPTFEWLLMVESLGVIVFDDDEVRLHAKAVVYTSRGELEKQVNKTRINETAETAFCCIEVSWNYMLEGNFEKADSMDTSQTEVTTVNDGRKRKDGWRDELEVSFKLLRCHPHENCKFFAKGMNGGLSNGWMTCVLMKMI